LSTSVTESAIGRQALAPALQVRAPVGARPVLPGIVGRQIEFAGTPGDADTAADAHEPVVVRQGVAGLAGHAGQAGEAVLDLRDDAVERLLRDGRIAPEAVQDLALPIQVLQQVGLQVGTCANVHDLEDRRQGIVVVDC
jgi:hypothetical protein